MQVVSTPTDAMTLTNLVYVAPSTFPKSAAVSINAHIFFVQESSLVKPQNIALNARQRATAMVGLGDVVHPVPVDPQRVPELSCVTFGVKFASKFVQTQRFKIDGDIFSKDILKVLIGHVMHVGQQIVSSYDGRKLVLIVRSLEFTRIPEPQQSTADASHGTLHAGSIILLSREQSEDIAFVNLPGDLSAPTNTLFPEGFSFATTGIGGLGKELEEIFRRAFESRLYPKSVIKKLNLRHIKGILLHGPPGCGKTLIARRLAAMLGCSNLTIVNGPELFDKYVGQTEANIRQLFAAAEAEQHSHGEDSSLHILVFDEFDSMVKKRGSMRDNTGTSDSAVNQLLAKMDGPEELNNILLIAMTNRKDLIDEAVLRPGRFEVHIAVKIPDEQGRLEIFQIRTKQMRENGLLDESIDLANLAARTKNYTGAEIEGIVNNAASFATHRHIDPLNPTKFHKPETLSIQNIDFDKAIACSKPMLGVAEDMLDNLTRGGIVPYGRPWTDLVSFCVSYLDTLRVSTRLSTVSLLLHGAPGTGKAGLAAHVAKTSDFPFIKVIHPSQYIGMSELAKCNAIRETFEDADSSPLSIVILSDIERLIDFVHLGMRFSNAVLQAILVKLKHQPPSGKKLIILGTSSDMDILEKLDVASAFHAKVEVPSLLKEEQRTVLRETGVSFVSAEEEELAMNVYLPEAIPIKRLMLVIERARALKLCSGDEYDGLMAQHIKAALE